MRQQVLVAVVLVALALVVEAVDLERLARIKATKKVKQAEGKTKADLEVKVKKANEEELKYQRGQIAHQQNVWEANKAYDRLLARTNAAVAGMQAKVKELRAQLLAKSAQSSFVKDSIKKINALHATLKKFKIKGSKHTASAAKLGVLERQARAKLAEAERTLTGIKSKHGLEEEEVGEKKTRATVESIHLKNEQQLLKLKEHHRNKEIAESKKSQADIKKGIAADQGKWKADLKAARKRAADRTKKMQVEFNTENARDQKVMQSMQSEAAEKAKRIISGEASVKKEKQEAYHKKMGLSKEKGAKEAKVKQKAEQARKTAREKDTKNENSKKRKVSARHAEHHTKSEGVQKKRLAEVHFKTATAKIKEEARKATIKEEAFKTSRMLALKASYAAAAAKSQKEARQKGHATEKAQKQTAKTMKRMTKAMALSKKVEEKRAKFEKTKKHHDRTLVLQKLKQKALAQKAEEGHKHVVRQIQEKVHKSRARDTRERKRKDRHAEKFNKASEKKAKAFDKKIKASEKNKKLADALVAKAKSESGKKQAIAARQKAIAARQKTIAARLQARAMERHVKQVIKTIKQLRLSAKEKSKKMVAHTKAKAAKMRGFYKKKVAEQEKTMSLESEAAMNASHAQILKVQQEKTAAEKAQATKAAAHLSALEKLLHQVHKAMNISTQLSAIKPKLAAEETKYDADLKCLTHKMEHAHPHPIVKTSVCSCSCCCIQKVVNNTHGDVDAIKAKYAQQIKNLEATHKTTVESLKKQKKTLIHKKEESDNKSKKHSAELKAQLSMYKVTDKAEKDSISAKFADKLQKAAAALEEQTFKLHTKHAVILHKVQLKAQHVVAHIIALGRTAVHKLSLDTEHKIDHLEISMHHPPDHVAAAAHAGVAHTSTAVSKAASQAASKAASKAASQAAQSHTITH